MRISAQVLGYLSRERDQPTAAALSSPSLQPEKSNSITRRKHNAKPKTSCSPASPTTNATSFATYSSSSATKKCAART
jgi:hypothetical protein